MMRVVNHPNILRVNEVYEGDNNVYCLGKLYKGDTLSNIINDPSSKIDNPSVCSVAFRLLEVGSNHTGTELPRGDVHHS